MAKNVLLCMQLLLAFPCIKEWAINQLLILELIPNASATKMSKMSTQI
jgi:hypothetical protein